jgi:hypothetical protein
MGTDFLPQLFEGEDEDEDEDDNPSPLRYADAVKTLPSRAQISCAT